MLVLIEKVTAFNELNYLVFYFILYTPRPIKTIYPTGRTRRKPISFYTTDARNNL